MYSKKKFNQGGACQGWVNFVFLILLYYFINVMIKTLYISSFNVYVIYLYFTPSLYCYVLMFFSLLKSYFFFARNLSKIKLCLELHDTFVLFRTFFSPVNNKQFFFQSANPLNSCGKSSIVSWLQGILVRHAPQNLLWQSPGATGMYCQWAQACSNVVALQPDEWVQPCFIT